jgi:hypothetical protein
VEYAREDRNVRKDRRRRDIERETGRNGERERE